MTDDRMALIELIEKDADTDLVREMLSFAAERLMEAEVESPDRSGAWRPRDPGRLVQRNGYRDRGWDTRAGRIELEIPKLRKWKLLPLVPRTPPHRREGAHGRHSGSLRSWRLDPLGR